MALTESTMLALGTKAPDFHLANTNRGLDVETASLSDFSQSEALLVAFICNHCPYVVHIKPAFAAFAREYCSKGLGIAAICSNDATTHPADSPQKMAEDAETYGYVFPYLHDETQDTARAYRAECTPEFYLFDSNLQLAYRGQFDGSRPGNSVQVTGEDLRNAVDALLGGERPSERQLPSVGCSIKWKP